MAVLLLVLAIMVCTVRGMYVDEYHNPMINDGLFDGDILMDLDEERNAVPRDSQLWPNGTIPYIVDPSLEFRRDNLMKGMRHIENHTCIRFVPKQPNHKDFINMFVGKGCYSHWGRIGRNQSLSLGPGCYPIGTVVHELLHAIGFEHEHNRSDRDDYLIINWENIEEKWHSAFRKLAPNRNRLLSTFDYNSIMLYGQTSFAKRGLKSMESRDGRFLPEVYNKKSMSPSDIYRINTLYKCKI